MNAEDVVTLTLLRCNPLWLLLDADTVKRITTTTHADDYGTTTMFINDYHKIERDLLYSCDTMPYRELQLAFRLHPYKELCSVSRRSNRNALVTEVKRINQVIKDFNYEVSEFLSWLTDNKDNPINVYLYKDDHEPMYQMRDITIENKGKQNVTLYAVRVSDYSLFDTNGELEWELIDYLFKAWQEGRAFVVHKEETQPLSPTKK